jgi:predicted Zn-dependent peptidase
MNRHLQELIPVLKEIIFNPVFPEKELEVLKKIQYNNLQISREKNSYVASTKFREILFGRDHPYGRTVDEAVINNQNAEDLKEYHSAYFPENFEIIISGMAGKDVVKMMEREFSDIRRVRLKAFEEKPLNPSMEKVHLKREGSYQSALRIGHLSIRKDHPDFIRVMVMNELFGGYFGSRLMQNIREDKGYTYGIYSSLVSYREAGYFVIAADVKKEFTGKAIDEIYKEVRILRNERVPEEELNKVKNYLKGNYLSSITTPFSIAEKFKNVHFYGLSYSFYDHLFKQIDQIGTDDIVAMARQYLNPEKMSEVVVG